MRIVTAAVRDLWNALTYRNEWTNAPARMRMHGPADAPGKRYKLVMWKVDRRTGEVWMAAAQGAKNPQ